MCVLDTGSCDVPCPLVLQKDGVIKCVIYGIVDVQGAVRPLSKAEYRQVESLSGVAPTQITFTHEGDSFTMLGQALPLAPSFAGVVFPSHIFWCLCDRVATKKDSRHKVQKSRVFCQDLVGFVKMKGHLCKLQPRLVAKSLYEHSLVDEKRRQMSVCFSL